MTRNISNFILTILLSVALSWLLPWWSVMLGALLTSILVPLKKSAVFLAPFFAIMTLWIVQTFLLSSANDFILAKKISELLYLGGSPYLLILITGILGGIAAGISGVLGKQLLGLGNSQ